MTVGKNVTLDELPLREDLRIPPLRHSSTT